MDINGTFADDLIVGTDGPDVIRGDWGNDVILAGAGHDIVYGGQGDDIIEGGDGNDTLNDEEGEDKLYGGNGDDTLLSQFGSGGWDLLDGGSGDNLFLITRFGTFGHVRASGQSGIDSFTIADGTGSIFEIDAGGGNDNVSVQNLAPASNLSVMLGAGADMLSIVAPSTGRITVGDFEAGDGGDRIEWMSYLQPNLSNYDRVSNIFATGHARLVQNGADTLVQIDRDAAGGTFGWWTLVTLRSVDASTLTGYNLGGYNPDGSVLAGIVLAGTAGADRMHGTMSADTLEGQGGRDIAYGGGGDDVVRGGAGADTLYGHYGNDLLEGGDDNDVLDDGHGNDKVYGEGGNDQITNTASGNDLLDGGAGNDVITVSRVGALADSVTIFGGADIDRISIASQTASSFTADAGSGDDRVNVNALFGSLMLTLGTGSDRLVLNLPSTPAYNQWGAITITDFETGNAGDVFDFAGFLRFAVPNWDQVTNPFSNGLARLVQSGNDLLFQISNTGNPANFKTIVTFQNQAAANFTAWNTYGWPADGSPPPGLLLTGTASGDSIEGTAGNDTIEGLGGLDILSGGAGDDTIRGGDQNDTLQGGAGNDLLEGGAGNDSLRGDAGNDQVHGGEGDDTITSNGGTDSLFGEGGDDRFNVNGLVLEADGGTGQDIFEIWLTEPATTGTMTIRGGDGDDLVYHVSAALADFVIDMGAGNDSVWLASDRDSVVTLGAGIDRIGFQFGPPTAPRGVIEIRDFQTGDGGDFLAAESLIGFVEGLAEGASAFSNGSARLVQQGDDTLFQVDADGAGSQYGYVTAAIFRDTLASSFTRGNLGYGTDGADLLRLDIPWGLEARGAGGDDIFFLGAEFGADDYLDGDSGFDSVILQGDYSTGFAFEESSLIEVERLVLLSGSDSSFGGSGAASYQYLLSLHDENLETGQVLEVDFSGLLVGENVIFDGSLESDARLRIIGGAGEDAIFGGSGDDDIGGGAGDDLIDGGAGADALKGGSGDDLYAVDAQDTVVELAGEGIDTITTFLGDPSNYSQMYTLPDNVENLIGTAASGQGVYGNALDNHIRMAGGNDLVVLDGGGNDRVESGGGADYLYFGGSFTNADSVDGGAGSDTVGLVGNYTIRFDADDLVSVEKLAVYSSGDAAAPAGYDLTMIDSNVAAGQTLTVIAQSLQAGELLRFNGSAETNGSFNVKGGRGGDTITGGAGNDILWGNLGADTLKGGGGADVFIYQSAAESHAAARDLILDFAQGDRVGLLAIDADGNAANGDSRFAFIGSDAFHNVAGELRVTQDSTYNRAWLVEGDTNGDGTADFSLYVVAQPGQAIGANDFLL
ncbi:MAG TPA: calcium-binding protein [Allosphingosinicella sp.]|jgi:Ca2+-binding RTX toxin-like protein